MGKLAHIREGMVSSQSMLDGVVKSVGEYVASVVVDKLTGDMQSGADGLTAIQEAVRALEPAICAEVKSAIAEVSNGLQTTQKGIQSSSDRLTATQRSLMQAIASLNIPDHSEQLGRIERKGVDLDPLHRQLTAILLKLDEDDEEPEEKEPREWKFHVKRNKANLIESVTAEAVDGGV